jgi:hypothetical protein
MEKLLFQAETSCSNFMMQVTVGGGGGWMSGRDEIFTNSENCYVMQIKVSDASGTDLKEQ